MIDEFSNYENCITVKYETFCNNPNRVIEIIVKKMRTCGLDISLNSLKLPKLKNSNKKYISRELFNSIDEAVANIYD